MEKIWNEIVEKTKQFVDNTGHKKVVLGLSGGIDSAIVLAVAATSMGKDNVLAVMMPSPYSSKGSITDSKDLCDNFKINSQILPIESIMKSFDGVLDDTLKGTEEDTTEENIQARIRAVLLMALSNKFGYLVLNTCNKSEDWVGYCTLYGDSCGAIGPIGDLYKTEVYELAKWINQNPSLPNIPQAIIDKEPSAELKPGQKDTDSLLPYDELDPILKLYVDDKYSLQQIIEKGFSKDAVEKTVRLVDTSAYKRDQCPPVIKLER